MDFSSNFLVSFTHGMNTVLGEGPLALQLPYPMSTTASAKQKDMSYGFTSNTLRINTSRFFFTTVDYTEVFLVLM